MWRTLQVAAVLSMLGSFGTTHLHASMEEGTHGSVLSTSLYLISLFNLYFKIVVEYN